MVVKKAFLLIELLASLTIFIIFVTLIINFQVVCNKTTNAALQSRHALNLSLTDMERLKRSEGVSNKEDKKYRTFVEFFTVGAIKDFRMAKVTVTSKLGITDSKVSLISSC